MVVDTIEVGRWFEPHTQVVDLRGAVEYAAATNDADPAYAEGLRAAPTYGYVVAHEAYRPHLDALIPERFRSTSVQAGHDLWFHRPLVPGRRVTSRMTIHGVQVRGSGSRIALRVSTWDAGDGGPILDQYSVIYVFGLTEGASTGQEVPDHTFPETARTSPVAAKVVHVDEDQASRYADASGDRSPIHVDPDFARSAGFPGVILQGMCTMAICGRGIADTVADGDASRLARLAVHFRRPLLPGRDLALSMYDAGRTADGGLIFAFEGSSADHLVVSDGRANVRP
jgi:acyl dehydratase